jgi:hypothetical protein
MNTETPDMSIHSLFLALIILTCVILVLILVLLLSSCIKARDKPRTSRDIEDHASTPDQAIHPCRPQIQHDHYNEKRRLSHLTTITPSIELLPEIRTSSERVDDWLERKDSRVVEEGVVKGPKTQRVLGVKSEGQLTWDWRSEKLRGGADVAEKVEKKEVLTERK